MKQAALRGALSDRARNGRVHVLSSIVHGDAPSTKTARITIAGITERPRVLVVLGRDDQAGWLSLRNLPSLHVIAPDQLNTYDVLLSDDVLFTADALKTFLAGPARGRSATASARSSELVSADSPADTEEDQ
jgi:large subunit ribosomal protein L4